MQNRKETYKYLATFKNVCGKAESLSFAVDIDGSYNFPSTMIKESFSSTDKYGTNRNGNPLLSDVDKFKVYDNGHLLFIEEKKDKELFKKDSWKLDRILKNGKASVLYVEVKDYLKEEVTTAIYVHGIKTATGRINPMFIRFKDVPTNKLLSLIDLLIENDTYIKDIRRKSVGMEGKSLRIATYDREKDKFTITTTYFKNISKLDLSGASIFEALTTDNRLSDVVEDTATIDMLADSVRRLIEGIKDYANK